MPTEEKTIKVSPDELRDAIIKIIKEKGVLQITAQLSDGVKKVISDGLTEAKAGMQKQIDELVKKASTPVCKEITIRTSTETITIKELTHFMMPNVVSLVATKFPVYLWGAAGAGKTTLAYQIARAMGLKYYPIFGGPTLTESKLLGYRNASTGHYVKGMCYDAYVNGGLLFIDEADVGEGLIGLNALLANDVYRFPDGEVVERHQQFHVLAAGNTNWNGASGSYKRQAADGAFKDRFIRVPFHYDEALELAIVENHYEGFVPWAKYIHNVRKYVATQTKDNRAIIGPRAIFKGAASIRSGGMSVEQAIDWVVLVDLSDDIKIQVKKQVEVPELTFKMEK